MKGWKIVSDDAPWAERPPHIQRYTDTRNGRERVYFRKAGHRKVELKAAWGTQALADEVAALLKGVKAKPAPELGTMLGAIRAYRGDSAARIAPSAEFITLAPSTQIEYERVLDEFEKTFVNTLLEDIDAGVVLDLRDKWAIKGYRAANLRLQIMKNVCKGPRIRGEIAGDPFALIEKVRRPQSLGESNPRWEDAEVAAAIAYAIERKKPGLARAIALGRWGGFRKQSICGLPRSARITRPDENGAPERRLLWVTEKRLVLCDRREDPRLTELLARTPPTGNVEPLTVAYNAQGQRWRPRALSHAIDRLIAVLAKRGAMREGLTVHGLRHARGVELASRGASDAEIMTQLDHATPRAAQIYRRQADRVKMADAAQNKVDAMLIHLGKMPKTGGQA